MGDSDEEYSHNNRSATNSLNNNSMKKTAINFIASATTQLQDQFQTLTNLLTTQVGIQTDETGTTKGIVEEIHGSRRIEVVAVLDTVGAATSVNTRIRSIMTRARRLRSEERTGTVAVHNLGIIFRPHLVLAQAWIIQDLRLTTDMGRSKAIIRIINHSRIFNFKWKILKI